MDTTIYHCKLSVFFFFLLNSRQKNLSIIYCFENVAVNSRIKKKRTTFIVISGKFEFYDKKSKQKKSGFLCELAI